MSLQQANLMTIEAPKLLVMDTGHPRVAQRSPAPVPIKTCTLGHGYGYLLIWAWVLEGSYLQREPLMGESPSPAWHVVCLAVTVKMPIGVFLHVVRVGNSQGHVPRRLINPPPTHFCILHGRKTPDSHLQVREMEEWWQWYAASMASHYTGPPCMYSPHPAQKCMPTALRGEQGHATMIRGVREREGEEEEEGEWWW
ncbi:hypothetical protein CPB84DRAFT_1756551 [Gymnopilus junonius]|uniref:Uncharacterized protein n=1 Tax=Gymnopilus junonius TaxID=109634 RepID=A0A9P5N8Q1_GYMJU|nr:hypothetical protein CPB84DRAFT_1756551 [Gymnopilus junonius]